MELKLEAPELRPRKYQAIGLNYESHAAEAAKVGLEKPKHQIWFNKQVTCINGPYDPIHLPSVSDQLDYECELGLVIGKRCRHIKREEASSVIAGYLICNDVSVRDWQMRSPTATLGKSFDTHGPIGPWLVTPDEIGDMAVAVNRLAEGLHRTRVFSQAVGSGDFTSPYEPLSEEDSLGQDSFAGGRLSFPQYTRPSEFQGWKVPEVLLSGDHGAIARWRDERMKEKTRVRRPDMAKQTKELS